MASANLTRRQLLHAASILAGAAALAACDRSGARLEFRDWSAWWSRQERRGVVDFANWPYYIDRRRDNSHPSLELFTERTGIRVRYTRPIRDNQRFLAKIEPDLRAGRPTGYDIVVMTNGPQLSEMIENEWLIPLDHSRLPNFRRYASPIVRDPSWDADNRYSVAWQSGLTGIAYGPQAVQALGRKPSSVRDLFEPALSGRVGMLVDLLDLGCAGLLAIGRHPSTSDAQDWNDAAAYLIEQRDRGIVRKYYDQGYLNALQRGDVWISQAWSGDIYQANRLGHPELRFAVPSEGVMFWTDNMLIPRGAQHPLDALELMNFVYEPKVAAMIADWVWYICPVPAARGIVANRLHDPRVANSPLVFPTRKLLGPSITEGGDRLYLNSPLRDYPRLATREERAEWQRIFGAVVNQA